MTGATDKPRLNRLTDPHALPELPVDVSHLEWTSTGLAEALLQGGNVRVTRRPEVVPANLNQLLPIRRFEGLDHGPMVVSCPGEMHGVCRCVRSYAVDLLGKALDDPNQMRVATGPKERVVEGHIFPERGSRVSPLNGGGVLPLNFG